MEVGSMFAGRYQIQSVCPAGLYTKVYRVMDTTLNRECLLKVPAKRPDQAEATARFLTEARLMASLSNTSYVAQVYDAGEADGLPFFTQELVEGEDLGSLLERKDDRRMALAEGLSVLSGICRGVHAAHEAGVRHGDIKPENVMVTPSGKPKVIDFGAAQALTGDTIGSLDVMGTLHYCPPEYFRPDVYGHHDERSDIWALGVLVHVVLTGRHPYGSPDGLNYVQWAYAIESKPSLEHAPQQVRDIIGKCLQPHKKDRFPRVDELAAAIDKVRNGMATKPTNQAHQIAKRAIAEAKAGNHAAALDLLKKACQIEELAFVLAWAGYCLECTRQPQPAARAYIRALKKDPSCESARGALIRLIGSGDIDLGPLKEDLIELGLIEPNEVLAEAKEDIEIPCDCGEVFTWSVGEQEFYAEKGFDPPKRCETCRKKKKQKITARQSGKYQGVVKMVSGSGDWGFIQVEDMPDIFFHITDVRRESMPVPKQTVAFRIGPPGNDGKPKAVDVEPI